MRGFVCLSMACMLLHAQPGVKPQFEAASIKAATGAGSQHGPGGPGTANPGQIEFANYSLRDLLFRAYDVMPNQISVPTWMDDGERFDVLAKLPAEAAKRDVPLMLQTLLEERFHVEVRHELRDTPAYSLTQGKGGSKMNAYPELLPENFVEAPRFAGMDEYGAYIVAPGYVVTILGSQNGISTITLAREPVRDLCKMLSKVLRRPVVDQTGLIGAVRCQTAFRHLPGFARHDG